MGALTESLIAIGVIAIVVALNLVLVRGEFAKQDQAWLLEVLQTKSDPGPVVVGLDLLPELKAKAQSSDLKLMPLRDTGYGMHYLAQFDDGSLYECVIGDWNAPSLLPRHRHRYLYGIKKCVDARPPDWQDWQSPNQVEGQDIRLQVLKERGEAPPSM